MNYILLHASFGRDSMRRTVEKMTEPCNLLVRTKDGWVEEDEGEVRPISRILQYFQGNNIINWGNRIFGYDGPFKVNKPSAIALASDKAFSRVFLQDAGVAVPKTYLPELTFTGILPIIARPSHHHGGKEFYVIRTPDEYNALASQHNWNLTGWYFSEIFEKTHEYRVHCGHGKVLFVNEKPLVEGELRANQAVNHEAWRALKWSEFNPKICQESLRAVEVLGLDYGAVDIMHNAEDDSVTICEVNTSPSITTEYSSGKYAAYFSWLIRHEFPEHFPIEGKSVFYNELLRN